MNSVDDLRKEIAATRSRPEPGYGGNVLPAMRIYQRLNSRERENYFEALKGLLASESVAEREFTIALCLGFFALRDVLAKGEG